MGLPINETPDLSDLRPMGPVPQSWPEQIGAAWEAQRWIENVNQSRRAEVDLYSRRIDEIQEATGVRLDHPLMIHDPRERTLEASRIRRFEARVNELRNSNSDFAARIGSHEDWQGRLRERIQGIAEDAEGAGFVPSLIGGVLGSFEDPLNLATLPVGGGKSILQVASREAGLNAMVEGLSLPAGQRWRQEMGLDEMTTADMAFRVGVGAVFGGVAGGGGRALEIGWGRLPWSRQAQALRDLAPDDPEVRGLADLLDREAEIEASNPLGDSIEADAAHREFLEWGHEAASGGDLSPDNPYRRLEVPPSVAREIAAEEDMFVRAARLGEPLPDELTSIRQVRAAATDRVAEWYDRNVFEIERDVGAYSLTVQSPDANMVMHLSNAGGANRSVMFTLDGRTQNSSELSPREAVAAGSRSMARAAATLRGFIARHPEADQYAFSGATAAHNRFYRSLMASFDNPEWIAYTGPRQSTFYIARVGSAAEEQLRDGNFTRIEPRRLGRPESAGDDGRGDRGRTGGDGVRRTEPRGAGGDSGARPAGRVANDRQADLFDQPGGEGARGQLAQLEGEQRALTDDAAGDMIPTGRIVDDQPEMISRADIEAELDAEQSLLAGLRSCALGGGS